MKTVLIGIAVFIFSGFGFLLIGTNIVPGLTGLLSIAVAIGVAIWYQKAVAKPAAEKEKAQTELIYSMREELTKLSKPSQETIFQKVERERLSQMTDKDKLKVEREKLSHKAKRDKEKSHIARLNEAVKAAEELNSRTSKPQAENEDMKGYRENMQRQMDDALSAAEELRKKQGED